MSYCGEAMGMLSRIVCSVEAFKTRWGFIPGFDIDDTAVGLFNITATARDFIEANRENNQLEQARAEVARLKAIVDRLPITKDKGRVIPSIDVVFTNDVPASWKDAGCTTRAGHVLGYDEGWWASFEYVPSGANPGEPETICRLVSHCYSTRAAAEAAREADRD